MTVLNPQGYTKLATDIVRGTIIGFSGTRVPLGWALCNGTFGTPDLTDRFLVGDTAAGTGSAVGTVSMESGLLHTGFALGNHSNHSPTQPSVHSAHSPTQPSEHTSHVATQPALHGTHANQGGHTHDNHPASNDGSAAAVGTKLTGPSDAPHTTDGGHTHDAHSAHTGWGVDAHSSHSGFAVDAHSAHAGFAVDAHSVHVVGQPATHILKSMKLIFIMKL